MTKDPSPSTWSPPGLARAALVGLLALGSGAASGWMVAHEPPPARPAAGADVRALVAPLSPGARLGGFTLVALSPVEHGAIRIDLARGAERRAVGIALATAAGPRPPLTVGPYALFYFGSEAAADLTDALAALAEVLRANRQVPIPAGLGRIAP